MIRYSLRCRDGHGFESWFYDSASFDDQTARGLLACPVCGSQDVSKAIMAPALVARGRSEGGDVEPAPPSPAPSDGEQQRQRLRALREAVLSRTRDVGRAFAEEARRLHGSDDADGRIRGQATVAEARELIEDGILVLPLPAGPDELN